MRAYEFAAMPLRVGIQPVKWFGGLVIDRATQVARSNIIELWRRPWELEVREHLHDARDRRDFSRAEEQRILQTFIEQCAPRTAEEFEEMAAQAHDKPDKGEVDDILGP